MSSNCPSEIESAHIHIAGAGVVDRIGRVAADEAWAEFLTNALDAFDRHRAAGVDLGEDIGCILDVGVTVTTGEEDAFCGDVIGHAQGVDGGAFDHSTVVERDGWHQAGYSLRVFQLRVRSNCGFLNSWLFSCFIRCRQPAERRR